jgi:hypothetical protein
METIPPSGSPPAHVGSHSGDDPEFDEFQTAFDTMMQDSSLSQGLRGFAANLYFWCLDNPNSGSADLKTYMTSVITGTYSTPPEDVFWQFGMTGDDLKYFEGQCQQILNAYSDSYTFPAASPTPIDLLFAKIWNLSDNYGAGMKGFIVNGLVPYFNTIGSYGSIPDVNNWLNSQFEDPNFAAKYPGMTYSSGQDLVNFAQAIGYPLPPFAQGFIETVACLQGAQAGSDDAKFCEQLVTLCQQNWTSGNNGPLNALLQKEVSSIFSDYPGLSTGIVPALADLETEAGVAVPATQGDLFAARDWIATGPTGDDLKMAQDFLNLITSNWPGQTVQNLDNWFTGTDLYITYPNVSDYAVSVLAGILNLPIPPKNAQIMSLYQNLLAGIQNFQPGSNEYRMYTDAINLCKQQGSNGNWPVFTSWLAQQWQFDPLPFNNYQGLRRTDVLDFTKCFGIQYQFQYYPQYMIYLGYVAYKSPIEMQLAIKLRSVFSAYMLAHPNDYSISDLNSYLKTYYADANNDLCLAIPKLSPFAIDNFFSDLELQNPYPYRIADYAYAGVCQALDSVTNPEIEPDYDILTKLTGDIRNAIVDPSNAPYQNVLAEVKAIKNNPQEWDQLQATTRQVLNAILDMGPG